MIEIIKEFVEMPSLTERRFQKVYIKGKNWEVIDSLYENKAVFKGNYEMASIACHNLNKKYYRNI